MVKRKTKDGTRIFQYEIIKNPQNINYGKQRKLPINKITGVIGQEASCSELE